MKSKTSTICLSVVLALAFPVTGLAENTLTSPESSTLGIEPPVQKEAMAELVKSSIETAGMPCPMHRGGMKPGPGTMMEPGMMHRGPGGMMGYGGPGEKGKPCRMKGAMKGYCKEHQARHAPKHEDVISRLNRIEAALAKIEAMLNHLVNQR